MSRVSHITIVYEGWEDGRFITAFLGNAADIARKPNPKGRGCGYDWVVDTFVQEVGYLQKFNEGWGVIGLLDEDGKGEARRNQIIGKLREKGFPNISESKGRCLLLAIRNIETWAYWLNANRLKQPAKIDQKTDYKMSPPKGSEKLANADFAEAGRHLLNLNHKNMPDGCPPGLVKALEQLRAFVQAVKR